jgi:hypothetical protein
MKLQLQCRLLEKMSSDGGTGGARGAHLVTMRIVAANPAAQILVTDHDEEEVENGRGIGELTLRQSPGSYSILHWGGHYFAWSEPAEVFDSPRAVGSTDPRRALEGVGSAIAELANKVSMALEASADDIETFCDEVAWSGLTSLERRIVDYLTANFPADYFELKDVPIEQLSQHLSLPAPLVALAVNKLVSGEPEINQPPPQLPLPTNSVQKVLNHEPAYAYAR